MSATANPSSSGRLPRNCRILSIAGTALLVAVGGWMLARRWPSSAPPAAAPAAELAPAPPAADAPIPASGDSDARLRSLLGSLAESPLFQGWLKNSDLLQRWVVSTVNIAEDRVPQRDLSFLAPKKPFKVASASGRTTLSPQSAARYEAMAKVVGAIDAAGFAQAYAAVHPWLETAYHQLGYPNRDFDQATTEALQRLADAKVVEGPVALRQAGNGLWQFEDPDLEKLGPVEKQLLRWGPANTRIVREKAREIAAALRLPLRSPPSASRE